MPTLKLSGVAIGSRNPMCDGCRYDMMGQRDHMDIGGCLNN